MKSKLRDPGATFFGRPALRFLGGRHIGSPNIWLCKVSCWGFSDSAAILEHVLKKAIQTIESHVCSSALLRLPEDYRTAISGVGEWTAAVFHLLGGSSEPGEQLERMRPMLKSLQARLVLIIEDLERNTSPGFDPEHVQALLHRFKTVDGVSFILVGKPRIAEKRLDYQKLCDHIEELPWMDHGVVRNSVVTLRRHWLDKFPIIDSDPNRRKYDKWGEEPQSRLLLVDHLYPWKSIVDLVQTPRAFKHSLSATDKMWESLHGEIDLDDLLVANVLRHAAPEAFEFILENSAALREKQAHSYGLNEQKKQHQKELRKRWNDQTKQVDWSTDAAFKLVQFLFPALGMFPSDRQALQGVRNHTPTDYWARYLASELNCAEIADQSVLRAIRDCSRSAEGLSALAANMHADRRFAWKWEYLVGDADHDALLRLADKLIELVLNQDGAEAEADGDALLGVWRKLKGRTKPEALEQWLEHIATRVLPASVNFFNDFRHLWISHVTGYYQDQDLDRVYAKLRTAVRSVFEGSSAPQFAQVDEVAVPVRSGTQHAVGEDNGVRLGPRYLFAEAGP